MEITQKKNDKSTNYAERGEQNTKDIPTLRRSWSGTATACVFYTHTDLISRFPKDMEMDFMSSQTFASYRLQ